jgi:Domain of unknown function (DUF1931)
MAVMAVSKFERLFHQAASIDVDKDDLKRYDDFMNRKVYDFLVRAQARAHADTRDIIEVSDLPLTKGIVHAIHEFKTIDEAIELESILAELTNQPPLDLAYSPELEKRLPDLVGGLTVALAQVFKLLDPRLKTPHTEQWERAFQIFDILL